jgi:hypothetical protein
MRCHITGIAPMHVVAIATWLLGLVATIELLTDLLGVHQLLAIVTILVTTIVFLLLWTGSRSTDGSGEPRSK